MESGILSIFGGLGIFLLGMTVMTDGLKNLAGGLLRSILFRFTRSPLKAAITGTLTTAAVQSSSATTVMAVGFVGAGLLTFPQALGVIFGANIGTTITGWLVALVGFKLNLAKLVLPLVFVGALFRLFGGRKLSAWGLALAGFGLVFIGISMLQEGMEVFKDDVTPDSFPSNTWTGRFLMVLIGIAITLVTQSSSAGVATAITALHVGNITLAQAAALVIGMDVGTTVTAAMAVIGGSTEARRTGLAHVIYNLMTGIVAFLFLPLYVWIWESMSKGSSISEPEIALVTFHTVFNALGVVAVLPFTFQFAELIKWLIPANERLLVNRLDKSLLKEPAVAMDNIQATTIDLSNRLLSLAKEVVNGQEKQENNHPTLDEFDRAIEETRDFMQSLDSKNLDTQIQQTGLTALHILDHLSRLSVRCRKESISAMALKIGELDQVRRDWSHSLEDGFLLPARIETSERLLERVWHQIDEQAGQYRIQLMQQTVEGRVSIEEALSRLDAFRWFRRICHHTWRVVSHLSNLDSGESPVEIEPESDI